MVTKKSWIPEELQKEADILYNLNLNPEEVEFVLSERLKAEHREYN